MEIICDPSGIYETPQASTLANPAQWLFDALGGRKADSGIPITWKNTLGISAAWYCVNVISNDIAQLPIELLYTKDGVTEPDLRHPAGKIIRQPLRGPVNSFHFRKTLQSHALVRGNGRAYIVRSGRREPDELIILPADRTVTVSVYASDTSRHEKLHVVFPEHSGEPIPLPDADVLHIFGISDDGMNGLSPLDILRNNFGLSLSSEKTANKFFKNNAVPGLVLEAPPGVFRKEEEAQEFLRRWNEYHSGVDNAGRAGLLREGIKTHALTMPFKDVQMIENREFQVREIMRVFGVPMIPGVSDSQSYNSLEQLNRAYLLHCLGPWERIWETECGNKLLTESEKRAETYRFAFDNWELVKPDANQRAEMLGKLVQAMIITPNEAREWEGLPPMEGGDELMNPATTPGKPPSEGGGSEATEPETDEQSTLNRRQMVANRLKPLVNAEIRLATKMASERKNFVSWVEYYYTNKAGHLASVVKELGGPEWIAMEYVEHSKEELLEIAGNCQPHELAANVQTAVALWPSRIDELALTICEATP